MEEFYGIHSKSLRLLRLLLLLPTSLQLWIIFAIFLIDGDVLIIYAAILRKLYALMWTIMGFIQWRRIWIATICYERRLYIYICQQIILLKLYSKEPTCHERAREAEKVWKWECIRTTVFYFIITCCISQDDWHIICNFNVRTNVSVLKHRIYSTQRKVKQTESIDWSYNLNH